METKRKTRVGRVVSNQMDKTVIVAVETARHHELYGKTIKKLVKHKAHDVNNECGEGDVVSIVETRPLSREKRWRVAEVLIKKAVVTVRPEDIG